MFGLRPEHDRALIREAVKRRAQGKCDYCGESGFKCEDGSRYLECHHIIALANDGADRITNVSALPATSPRCSF
ncbi:MAG: HNH endonuclease [Xanthobacteraceae bacterium]|nr:MAG: HNH endonuclease [Xanthobacteraceae bacterium]